jgi:hypothetical protein
MQGEKGEFGPGSQPLLCIYCFMRNQGMGATKGCISSCSVLTLPNNLFSTRIINQSINHVFSSIIHNCLPTFRQIFDPTLEEICQFGHEEVQPISELSVVVNRSSTQIVGERAEEVVI